MSNSITDTAVTLQRTIDRRREALRAVENAPNRGQWDYPTALRLAEERLGEAENALRAYLTH